MQVAVFILVVLGFVAISGALVRLVRVPLPVLQIAIGAALAWPARGLHVEIDPELFLLVFIPPLLFSDAATAPKRELLALRGPILDLAIGLVFFTIVGFGYALHWLVPSIRSSSPSRWPRCCRRPTRWLSPRSSTETWCRRG